MNSQRRPTQIEEFSILGRSIRLRVPADPDRILADATHGQAVDPYWGKIWDSAPHAAKCVLQTVWPTKAKVLEIGSGCGLLGIAGMFAGHDVMLSDHDGEAVKLAVENAQLNGFADAQGVVLDWNAPPNMKFDLLLASDVLYEEQFHQPLLIAADKLLKSGGSFRIGDPGRQLAKAFLQFSADEGWRAEIFDSDLKSLLMPTTNAFQWLVLKRC